MKPIKDKIDIQDSLIKRINQFNEEYSKELLDKIYLFIEKFKKEKGLYVLENESVIIDKMANEIVNDYQYKTNASNIGELLPTFDELNDVTIRILSTVNDDFDFDSLNLLPEQKFVINELTHNLLRVESLSVKIGNTIKKIISKNLLNGGSISDLKKDMELALLSNGYNDGMLSEYATQITTDAISQYTGIINDKLAKEANLNAIGYLGSIVGNSRVQCVRWKDQKGAVLLRNEKIDKLGYLPDEINWANKYGTGYWKEGSTSFIKLTEDNFMQYRGGRGCRHDALPFHFDDKYYTRYKKMKEQYDRETLKNIESQKNK